jgi:hypothetical protein
MSFSAGEEADVIHLGNAGREKLDRRAIRYSVSLCPSAE